MADFLQAINNNYASIITCMISLITAITTIVYVVFTHQQMKATQDSVKIMQAELKQAKQPCITISIKTIYSGTPLPGNGRRQMPVEFVIENIGDAPAISVFCISHLVLQYITDDNGNKKVDMFSGPLFLPCLKVDENEKNYLHYENQAIELMFKDLSVAMQRNWERIRTTPYMNPYRHTEIVIQVFYKNMNQQWFESKLTQEIAWGYDEITKNKTKHNLNEFTFPPRKLMEKDIFQLQLVSPNLSPLQIHMVDQEYYEQALFPYKERSPSIFRAEV